MKIAVTGSHGTIGSALVQHLTSQKHKVIGWDRALVPVSDYWAMENFLRTEEVEVLYHLAVPSTLTGMTNEGWVVNYQWTSELAWLCKVLQIRFVYISTVMVFSSALRGPFTLQTKPDAADGYGLEKRLAEERVFYQNPEARVIRLGWQIGGPPGSNDMINFLDKKFETEGLVACSTQWLPACSFLEDTVVVLAGLPDRTAGLYQFDTNERWNFYQIAFALNKLLGRSWKVTATDNFVFDQRMLDDRLPPVSLKSRLPLLKA
ncbi:MAG: sugar nucleotide-binding protein [Spirochaetales bacterium]